MMANIIRQIALRRVACAIAVTLAVTTMAGSLFPVAAQTSSKERVKAFAKLPDWTGIWELDAFVGQADGQQFSAEGQRRLKEYAAEMHPSFTPEYQAKYDEIRKKIQAAIAADPDHPPVTHDPLCAPPPFPATSSPGMYQWLVTPEETTFISTVGAVRHIYTDGPARTLRRTSSGPPSWAIPSGIGKATRSSSTPSPPGSGSIRASFRASLCP